MAADVPEQLVPGQNISQFAFLPCSESARLHLRFWSLCVQCSFPECTGWVATPTPNHFWVGDMYVWGRMWVPAGLPRQGNVCLSSHNAGCNFRQTFEVPDICIMCTGLLATGNSCLTFPRLNCNYTRPLPGSWGKERPLLALSKPFMFYSFPALRKQA